MQVARIRLQGFRNHNDTALDFGTGTNVIIGDNGQGKTNILEAISYLCLTKSFYAGSDAVVLGFGKTMFEVGGDLVSDSGVESRVRVTYVPETKEKVYALNKNRIEPFSSIIGRFPIVVLSPEHAPVTFGPPAERRRFVDLVISQANASYFEDLLEFRRMLKQRNKILLDARLGKKQSSSTLEPWNKQLVTGAVRLILRRKEFVEEFQSYAVSAYHHITDDIEEPELTYVPSVETGTWTESGIAEAMNAALIDHEREEFHLGTTLVGPHRDEFALTMNGMDLRKYASQGQHKTFLVALKVGEFFYLKERCRETPIVLLDDVFSELDERRTRNVLDFMGQLSQTFVTSTTQTIVDDTMAIGDRNRKFFVANGTVVHEAVSAKVN